MDTHKNFARSTLSAGIAAGAGSFSVAAGEGAKFDAGAQWITIWDSTTYGCADLDPNREIVRVSSRSTDTFTVSARGQRGTSDVAHNTGGKTYTVQQTLCGEDFDAMLENVLTTRGDLLRRGASLPERFGLGGFGASLLSDGTDPNWFAPQNFITFFDDFTTKSTTAPGFDWTAVTGSGAFSIGNGEAGRPGVFVISTASSASSTPSISKGATAVLFGGGKVVFRMAIKLSNLSDGTETYTLKLGFIDTFTARDGVWFEYTHSVNSGNWQGKTSKNFAPSTLNGSVAASTNWQTLECIVNAAGTSADFYVDGVQIGTASTNIPVSAGDETGFLMQVVKSAGTTARTVSVDYVLISQQLTTAR